jgi:hypothetical protein
MYVIRRLGQGERALFTVVWVQDLLRYDPAKYLDMKMNE